MESLSIFVPKKSKLGKNSRMPSFPGTNPGFFATAKETVLGAFLALPIVLIIVTGFFATATANVGMMILFLGQILAVPIVQGALTFFRGLAFFEGFKSLGPRLTYGAVDHRCSLSPVDVKDDQAVPPISYWMAQLIFFGTYVLSNAMTVYTADAETKDPDPIKVTNRKAQSLTAFIITALLVIVLMVNHYRFVGCDTPGSIALGLLLYVPLGYGFFRLAEVCGLRTADLFGIATKLFLPSSADSSYPYACVNIAPK